MEKNKSKNKNTISVDNIDEWTGGAILSEKKTDPTSKQNHYQKYVKKNAKMFKRIGIYNGIAEQFKSIIPKRHGFSLHVAVSYAILDILNKKNPREHLQFLKMQHDDTLQEIIDREQEKIEIEENK